MKFVNCVGAINEREVEEIFTFNDTKESVRLMVMPNGFQRKFPEKFPFGNNPEAMADINDEANAGPFQFLVIFYEE